MLIPSHRHTPEDLRLWRELEDGDIAYGEASNRRLDRLASESVEMMKAWTGDYIGTSWGKDSVVLLHLCELADIELPRVYVRMRGRDNPDCEAARDAFLERFPCPYQEREFVYENCGREEHWQAVEAEFGPRRATGLRMDESGARKMNVLTLGADTGKSFRPIAKWRSRDVFAWLAIHDLPTHPAYAMMGGGRYPREHLRVHGIGGERGSNMGRGEWEREYYGDVLARTKTPWRPPHP